MIALIYVALIYLVISRALKQFVHQGRSLLSVVLSRISITAYHGLLMVGVSLILEGMCLFISRRCPRVALVSLHASRMHVIVEFSVLL